MELRGLASKATTWLVLALALFNVHCTLAADAPMYSLNSPFTAEDNNNWETGAGTKVEADFVRLTPAIPSRSGYLWSRTPVTMTDWEIEVQFQLTGNHPNGGDGFAFWFVEKKMLGHVFGSADFWNGLGIFFDTFNNDGRGESPLVVAQFNDGTQKYFAFDDGVGAASGACQSQIRNSNTPVWAKITYLEKNLKVDIATSTDNSNQPVYHPCISVAMELGLDKYFGFTAQTGHPIVTNPPTIMQQADTHDIFVVKGHDLTPASTDTDRQKRREAYYKEVEEEHSQVTGYHALTSGEFQHKATTMLNQLQESQQLLESSHIAIENLLKTKKRKFEQEKRASRASTQPINTGQRGRQSVTPQDSRDSAGIEAQISTMLSTATRMNSLITEQIEQVTSTQKVAQVTTDSITAVSEVSAAHHKDDVLQDAQSHRINAAHAAGVDIKAPSNSKRGKVNAAMDDLSLTVEQALEEAKAVRLVVSAKMTDSDSGSEDMASQVELMRAIDELKKELTSALASLSTSQTSQLSNLQRRLVDEFTGGVVSDIDALIGGGGSWLNVIFLTALCSLMGVLVWKTSSSESMGRKRV